jgi:4-diphosphocytidyl-2-C-methyl-D-erythritol kinase
VRRFALRAFEGFLFTINSSMPVTVRSFAKINLGLAIGPPRLDGFHELRTLYQTIALHDIVRVRVVRGTGIEIRCEDSRVPRDQSNTCYRIVERAMPVLKARGRVIIEIEKRLPVQGGLGGASGNAVAALLALERELQKQLSGPERRAIAASVGSDLPLFLIGGTVLGVGRGEEVYPAPDLPAIHCLVATPKLGISTARAFADWDCWWGARTGAAAPKGSVSWRGKTRRSHPEPDKLTAASASDRMVEFGYVLSSWLSGSSQPRTFSGRASTGVPVSKGRGRAETSLLDLVRTGIENDFEPVVFPKYPELREVKSVLERAGAFYASLSGSGSAVYGLFRSRAAGQKAAARLQRDGVAAAVTTTLTRRQYWKKFPVSGF